MTYFCIKKFHLDRTFYKCWYLKYKLMGSTVGTVSPSSTRITILLGYHLCDLGRQVTKPSQNLSFLFCKMGNKHKITTKVRWNKMTYHLALGVGPLILQWYWGKFLQLFNVYFPTLVSTTWHSNDDDVYRAPPIDRSILPTAPRAAREPNIDRSRLPKSPPYTAFLGNLPYDVTEDSIKEFFRGLNVSVKDLGN